MLQQRKSPVHSVLGSLMVIALVIGCSAAAFAYTAGWLSPNRLTPGKMLQALIPPSGVPLGHRRNHAKGICFTGFFEANGNGTTLSRAEVFARGQYPALGRSMSVPPTRMRWMQRCGCAAWDCESHRPMDRNGGRP